MRTIRILDKTPPSDSSIMWTMRAKHFPTRICAARLLSPIRSSWFGWLSVSAREAPSHSLSKTSEYDFDITDEMTNLQI